jgi:uncharacterized protein (DUF2252 family)
VKLAAALVLPLALAGCIDPAPPAGTTTGSATGKADGFGGEDRDVLAMIAAWNQDLSPADRDAKYCKMAGSAFAFFRGTDHLFWADLAGDARLDEFGSTATRTILQGDLHAANVGAFDDDRGDVVYDLDDFDEAVIADYQYDVWRMATSIALVAREDGLGEHDAIDTFSEAYLDAMHAFHGTNDEADAVALPPVLDDFVDHVADHESRAEMLADWTVVDGTGRHFDLTNPELAAVAPAREAELRAAMPAYGATLSGGLAYDSAYFAVKSVAARLGAGIGSAGRPRYYLLVEGASTSPDDDRILDVKLETDTTAYAFLTVAERDANAALFPDPGARAVLAQKALLDHVDDHLGWMVLSDGEYLVRERSPYKKDYALDEIADHDELEDLAGAWGTLIAADHARADRDFDPALVPGSVDAAIDDLTDHHHDDFRDQVRHLAGAYADQVEADYATFLAGVPLDCP